MATAGGRNHCDPCYILDKIKVVSSSMCRECRRQLCDNCSEHHRRTAATKDHTIIPFQYQETSRTPAHDQKLNRSDQSGTKLKIVAHSTLTGRHLGTDGESAFALSGRRAQDDTRVQGKATSTQSRAATTQHQSETDTVDQDQTVTLKYSLNVKRENDELNCWITGLTVLQDKLITCDSYNSKLKVYDSAYKFLFEYKCKDAPYDIAMLDVNTVVVSSISSRNIRLLSVGNEGMKKCGKFFVRKGKNVFCCYGICCYRGDIYGVVGGEKVKGHSFDVRVYNQDGKIKQKFKHLYDGKEKCNDLQYITVNPQTGILYVTDKSKGVLVLSASGDVIAIMSPQQLDSPQGIAVEDDGHIYVCGSNKVIQMSPYGHAVVDILSSEDSWVGPQCVKIYGNKMFVSHSDPEAFSYKVSIYQLS